MSTDDRLTMALWRAEEDDKRKVAEVKTCADRKHYWPPDYSDGDTCNCGSFYLNTDGGGVVIEEGL